MVVYFYRVVLLHLLEINMSNSLFVDTYSINVNYSQKNVVEFCCIVALHINESGELMTSFFDGGLPYSYSYIPSDFQVSSDFDHSAMIEIFQVNGERRSMTIWKQTKPGEPVRWTFSSTIVGRDIGPNQISMYPELEKFLECLLEKG